MPAATARRPLTPAERETLARLWRERPDAKIREVRAAFFAETGRRAGMRTVHVYRPARAGARALTKGALARLGIEGPAARLIRLASAAVAARGRRGRLRKLRAVREAVDRLIAEAEAEAG